MEFFKRSKQEQKAGEAAAAENAMPLEQHIAMDSQGVPHFGGTKEEAVQKALESNQGAQ